MSETLVSALISAQAEIKQPTKNAVNPHFKSRFADLGACFDAVREPLRNNNLALVQLVVGKELVTTLLHTSGEKLESRFPLPEGGTPQVIGSAITYARRYALCAMLSLVAEDDDDGNTASNDAPGPASRKAYVDKARAARVED